MSLAAKRERCWEENCREGDVHSYWESWEGLGASELVQGFEMCTSPIYPLYHLCIARGSQEMMMWPCPSEPSVRKHVSRVIRGWINRRKKEEIKELKLVTGKKALIPELYLYATSTLKCWFKLVGQKCSSGRNDTKLTQTFSKSREGGKPSQLILWG